MKKGIEKNTKMAPKGVPPVKSVPEKPAKVVVYPLPKQPNIGDPVIKEIITDKTNSSSTDKKLKAIKTIIDKGEDQHLYKSPAEAPGRPGDLKTTAGVETNKIN